MNKFERYISYGLSVIPCEGKRPKVSWKEFQEKLPERADLYSWKNTDNIAIICGEVSGGVVCIDFDVKNGDRFDDWLQVLNDKKPELLSKMVIENTPSGGYHVVFRSDLRIGNVKLANNVDNEAMIETRGEGGYFVCYPSSGYSLKYGSFDKISKLDKEDAALLITLAKSLNENIEAPKIGNNSYSVSGTTPFDDYDSKHGVKDILLGNGWTLLFERGGKEYYKRPGKDSKGISATWNAVPDRFYCFSTSTQFENNHVYKASAVYSILEHNGDFSAAAKELYAKGYGKQGEKAAKVISGHGITDKLISIKEWGYPKGKTTGWNNIDKLYSIIKGQLTVITGYPSHGKSAWIDAMSMNIAKESGWKFAVFSPENYPVEMHYHKLVELYAGMNLRELSNGDLNDIVMFINSHYYFIDALEDEQTLQMILNSAQALIDKEKIDALIIDPWNEIELDKPQNMTTTEFIGKCLRLSRKFARRNNIHLWIVAHPTKPQKDKDGNYPIPDLYSIEGSAHWRNKADNGICVYRDFEENITTILTQKIKYRYSGQMGSAKLVYDTRSGRYEEVNEASNNNSPWD